MHVRRGTKGATYESPGAKTDWETRHDPTTERYALVDDVPSSVESKRQTRPRDRSQLAEAIRVPSGLKGGSVQRGVDATEPGGAANVEFSTLHEFAYGLARKRYSGSPNYAITYAQDDVPKRAIFESEYIRGLRAWHSPDDSS